MCIIHMFGTRKEDRDESRNRSRTRSNADLWGFRRAEPGLGESRIRVSAAALSPLARGRASGAHYSASHSFPFVAGVDGVGRLDDGRRVYFLMPRTPFGAMAEETVVPSTQFLPVPTGSTT